MVGAGAARTEWATKRRALALKEAEEREVAERSTAQVTEASGAIGLEHVPTDRSRFLVGARPRRKESFSCEFSASMQPGRTTSGVSRERSEHPMQVNVSLEADDKGRREFRRTSSLKILPFEV
ncbi:hypothetical protein AXG93_406s1290 [Marchantia polymorpha subsp. ruderalis]|uniref:Uncharacterized protein n=1 Tax=Marchantia polymorpha subsp. ruderalis TaxID=1480154 RepID=A0A176VCY1_MARPO|nr:hypothetical protein AXG93_406s1290 [Marchantia polymorpha subsp. ruderalis]